MWKEAIIVYSRIRNTEAAVKNRLFTFFSTAGPWRPVSAEARLLTVIVNSPLFTLRQLSLRVVTLTVAQPHSVVLSAAFPTANYNY